MVLAFIFTSVQQWIDVGFSQWTTKVISLSSHNRRLCGNIIWVLKRVQQKCGSNQLVIGVNIIGFWPIVIFDVPSWEDKVCIVQASI